MQLFWRGAWHMLWAIAVAEGAVEMLPWRKSFSLAQNAAWMEQLIEAEDELSNASKLVFQGHSGTLNELMSCDVFVPCGSREDGMSHRVPHWGP